MSKPYRTIAIALVLGFAVTRACAEEPVAGAAPETNLQVLIDAIRANRKALIAVNLGLNDEEAGKFWPVYDRYQQEINTTGDRVTAIVEDYTANYSTLSNEKALKLIEDYLAAEAERVATRRKYLPEFAKILPGRAVARFYQIENKMDAVLRYELAATIPVVEAQSGTPAK